MLGSNQNQAVAATALIADRRVQHFWNDTFITGEAFEEHNFGRATWDIYFLYGREATWREAPVPLVVSGSTVIGESEALAEALSLLMEGD